MFEDLKRLLEDWLSYGGLGTISRTIPDSHIVVNLFTFSANILHYLWVRLVYDLSKQGLVNGILGISLRQINENLAIIWVKDYRIICCRLTISSDQIELGTIETIKPEIPPAITLAIGGPSGSGKTTLLNKLRLSVVGDRIRTYRVYTTRPRREREINGSGYIFVDPQDLIIYRKNPRFINFVEARGYWYWTDPVDFFESRWRDRDAIHIFTITQVQEFLERRITIPDLQWIWLHAEEMDLRHRLEKRGDVDIESSLAHNRRLNDQDRTDLVSLTLSTKENDFDSPLQELLGFVETIQRRG